MINICQRCHQLLTEGERVTCKVTSTYHVLKSTVAYALDQNDLEADSSSLTHEECDRDDA